MRITDLLIDITNNLDVEVQCKISSGHRGYRECISPSLWTLKQDMSKQARQFFNPDELKEAGLVDAKHYETLKNSKSMDCGGYYNAAIGTLTHALYLPQLEAALRNVDVEAHQELKVWSHDTCVYGTADLVVFDEDGGMRVFDLKTCGDKILERDKVISDNYQRQLYAYAATLECMYPDKFIKQLSIVSICKISNSMGYDEIGNKTKLPLVAQCDLDYDVLDRQYHNKLVELIDKTKQIATALKKINNRNYWIIDGTDPNYVV